MSDPDGRDILTLEPFMESVREGVERGGWTLSGLQKTTSYQFEGRWEGDSTRSAYLFFHKEGHPGGVSIDVYLDETSRGLAGNLALVVDLVELADLGEPADVLRVLGALSAASLPPPWVTPFTLRLRLPDSRDEPGQAETEARFKVRIPQRAVRAGARAVRELSTSAVAGFEQILRSPRLAPYLMRD